MTTSFAGILYYENGVFVIDPTTGNSLHAWFLNIPATGLYYFQYSTIRMLNDEDTIIGAYSYYDFAATLFYKFSISATTPLTGVQAVLYKPTSGMSNIIWSVLSSDYNYLYNYGSVTTKGLLFKMRVSDLSIIWEYATIQDVTSRFSPTR